MSFEIVSAKGSHIKALLGAELRKLDVMEWESGLGRPIKKAFKAACYDPGVRTLRAMLKDGRVIAIWGVTDTGEEGIGSLWMLGAETKDDFRPTFFALWKAEIEHLHTEGARTLMAVADDRNKQHHRWLRTMGFTAMEQKVLNPDTTYTTYVRSRL